MKEVAKFYLNEKFVITGRRIVFTGHILDGIINIGNYVEFNFNEELIQRKIKGIELIRDAIQNEGVFDRKNTGILIECKNQDEIEKIKNSDLKDVEILIFEG